jgi:arginine exporter protein ArgO
MDQRKITNFLLLVIAVCLSLIVVHLYGLSAVQPVEADQAASQKTATEKPTRVEIANTPLAVAFANPQRVELVYQGRDGVMYSLADRDGWISCKQTRE